MSADPERMARAKGSRPRPDVIRISSCVNTVDAPRQRAVSTAEVPRDLTFFMRIQPASRRLDSGKRIFAYPYDR
jgi:hypothetical protein